MKKILVSAATALLAIPAWAGEPNSDMLAYVENNARAWFDTGDIQAAIRISNDAHAGMSEGDILALDQRWRAEVGQANAPMIEGIAASAVSETLRALLDDAGGMVTEIILMDNRGMNVAVSSVTSDFWQGDEDKYLQTYAKGAGGMHVSEVEFDESSQTYQVQVSFSISDVTTGAPIGAVTVGLNAELF